VAGFSSGNGYGICHRLTGILVSCIQSLQRAFRVEKLAREETQGRGEERKDAGMKRKDAEIKAVTQMKIRSRPEKPTTNN